MGVYAFPVVELTRHVRTPAGAEFFHKPIGAVISGSVGEHLAKAEASFKAGKYHQAAAHIYNAKRQHVKEGGSNKGDLYKALHAKQGELLAQHKSGTKPAAKEPAHMTTHPSAITPNAKLQAAGEAALKAMPAGGIAPPHGPKTLSASPETMKLIEHLSPHVQQAVLTRANKIMQDTHMNRHDAVGVVLAEMKNQASTPKPPAVKKLNVPNLPAGVEVHKTSRTDYKGDPVHEIHLNGKHIADLTATSRVHQKLAGGGKLNYAVGQSTVKGHEAKLISPEAKAAIDKNAETAVAGKYAYKHAASTVHAEGAGSLGETVRRAVEQHKKLTTPKPSTTTKTKEQLDAEQHELQLQLNEMKSGYQASEVVHLYPGDVQQQLNSGAKTVWIGIPSGSEVAISRELAQRLLKSKPTGYGQYGAY